MEVKWEKKNKHAWMNGSHNKFYSVDVDKVVHFHFMLTLTYSYDANIFTCKEALQHLWGLACILHNCILIF